MPHTTEIPVTWGDTDAGGLIYFPRLFHYAVVGLNDYFAPAADDGHLMEHLRRDGYVLPAVDAAASFDSPLRAGDTARVQTAVTDCGDASLAVAFTITRADDGERVAAGETTFVLVDRRFESTSLPDAMRECVTERGDS